MNSDLYEDVQGVHALRWNPRRPFHGRPYRLFRQTRHLPFAPRVNNFGDLLGPWIIRRLVPPDAQAVSPGSRLLSVGSVLHWAQEGDYVWGSGVNGKHLDAPVGSPHFRAHALRGPLTREVLRTHGVSVPDGVPFGDPGLLVGSLWPTGMSKPPRHGRVVVVPNLNDWPSVLEIRPSLPADLEIVSPTAPFGEVIEAIRQGGYVIGSSLHAIITAESFGVPCRAVRSAREPLFKYEDYFEGTGRVSVAVAESVSEALDMGPMPPLEGWAPDFLLAAFPRELWRSSTPVTGHGDSAVG